MHRQCILVSALLFLVPLWATSVQAALAEPVSADCAKEVLAGQHIQQAVFTIVDPEQSDVMKKLMELGTEVLAWGTECAVPTLKLFAVTGVLQNIQDVNLISDKYGGNMPPLEVSALWDWAKLYNASVQLSFSLNTVGEGAAALNSLLIATPALGVVMVPFLSAGLVAMTVLPIISDTFSQISGNLLIAGFVSGLSYEDYTHTQKAVVQSWAQDRGDIVQPGELVAEPTQYLSLWPQLYQDGTRTYKLAPDCRLTLLPDGTYALELYLFFYTMDGPPFLGTPNDLEVQLDLEFEGGAVVQVTSGPTRPYKEGLRTRELYGFDDGAEPVPLTTLRFPAFTKFPKDIVYTFTNPHLPGAGSKVIRLHPFHQVTTVLPSGINTIELAACCGETIPFSFELRTHPGWVWSEIETAETDGKANDPGRAALWASDLFRELGPATDSEDIAAELNTRMLCSDGVTRVAASLPASIYVERDGTVVSGSVSIPAGAEPGTYASWVLCTSAQGGVAPVRLRIVVSNCTAIAPTLLSASGTGTAIRLAWTDNSDNESAFEMWRRTGSQPFGASYYRRLPANTASYEDVSVSAGTLYTYKVRASVAGPPQVHSAFSNEAAADPSTMTPAPPSDPNVSESSNALVVTWSDASTDEQGFEIWRSVGSDGFGATYYRRLGSGVTEFADSAVNTGTRYLYKVRSYNAAGSSAFTAEVGCVFFGSGIAAPTQLSAWAVSAHHVCLTWRDNANNEQGYVVERRESGDRYYSTVSSNLPSGTELFDDTFGLDPSTTYVYRVRAYNTTSSAFSNETSCTTPSEVLGMAESPWPTDGGNEGRTGSTPAFGTVLPVELWRLFRLGAYSPDCASPVIAPDGTVYLSRGSTVHALDRASGAEKTGWPYNAMATVASTPSIDSNGRVYFGDTSGRLYAVRSDGRLDWVVQLTAGRSLETSVGFIRFMGDIYVLVTNGPYRFKLRPDGTIFWQSDRSFTYGSPAVDSSRGYFACGAGPNTIAVCDFDLNCRECGMTGTVPGTFEASTPTRDGTVYGTSSAGYLVAVDAATATIKWSAKVTEGWVGFDDQPPALGVDGRIYCIDETGVLHAWRDLGMSGVRAWDLALGSGSFQKPVVDGRGVIYVPLTGAILKAVRDLGDRGQVLWTYKPISDGATPFYTSVAVDATGTVYFATPANVTALRGVDSEPPTTIANLAVSSDWRQRTAALTWANPADPGLAEVVVRQKIGSWPVNHLDGGLASRSASPVPGSPSSIRLAGLSPGTTYYWAAFSCDLEGNWDEVVLAGRNAVSAVIAPPDTPAVFRIDLTGNVFADGKVFGQKMITCAGCADIAEYVSAPGPLELGTVLEMDPGETLSYRETHTACSQLVAGVVASRPGIVLGSTEGLAGQVLLALSGIVPVRVTNEGGPIQPGDLLVSSSTPGYAMRWAGLDPCPCALVGKALEAMTDERGMISVLLTAH
jgi:outer membrane protein assembly factor BamB